MGILKKSPKISPAAHAELQRRISALPQIQTLRAAAGDASMRSGTSRGWAQIPAQIRQALRGAGITIPDGYDVDMDGTLVYTNKTPFLQQAAFAALPIAGVSAVGALAGPATAAGTGVTAGGVLPSSTIPGIYGATVPTVTSGTVTGAGGGGFLGGLWGGIKRVGGAVNPFKRGGQGDRGGGFSARNWLDLVLGGGQTLADLWGANKTADAYTRAAEIQAQAAREALGLLREQWEKYNKDYEPFLTAGQGAIGRLSTRLEGMDPPAMPASVVRRLSGPGDTYTPGGTHTPMTLAQFGQPPLPRPTPGMPDSSAPSLTLGSRIDHGPVRIGVGTVPITLGNFGQTPVNTTMPVREGRSKLVTLIAPNGRDRLDLPGGDPLIRHYLSRGAILAGAA